MQTMIINMMTFMINIPSITVQQTIFKMSGVKENYFMLILSQGFEQNITWVADFCFIMSGASTKKISTA